MKTINIKTQEKRCEARAEYWEKAGVFYLRCWVGKKKKPVRFYRFGVESLMIESLNDFVNMYQRIADESAAQRQKEKSFIHDLKVGDILYSSWGWEQTNIDFYQVITLRGKKSIVVKPINADRVYDNLSMTGTKTPRLNDFSSDETKTGVFTLYGLKIESYARAVKWDGEPKSYSSYA